MNRLFLDASVLFAAAYSAQGYARDLIRLALEEKVRLVVSQDVLDETERNLQKKAPSKVPAYRQLLALIDPELVADPSKEEVWAAEAYVVQKDAPIIAAASKAKPDYLVTLDRKHLIDPPEVAAKSGLQIVLPEEIVQTVRNEGEDGDPAN